jgi:hypothetical protein
MEGFPSSSLSFPPAPPSSKAAPSEDILGFSEPLEELKMALSKPGYLKELREAGVQCSLVESAHLDAEAASRLAAPSDSSLPDNSLPEELTRKIMSYLSVFDLASVSCEWFKAWLRRSCLCPPCCFAVTAFCTHFSHLCAGLCNL